MMMMTTKMSIESYLQMTKKTFLLIFSLVLVVTVLSRSVMMVVVMLVMIYRSHQRRHVEFLF